MAAALVWMYTAAGLTPGAAGWPDIRDSAAARLSGFIIGSEAWLFARIATDNPALSRIVAQSVSDPKAAVEDVQRIKQNPKVAALLQDGEFTDAVIQGRRGGDQGQPALESAPGRSRVSSAAPGSWGFFRRSRTPPPRRSRRRTNSRASAGK